MTAASRTDLDAPSLLTRLATGLAAGSPPADALELLVESLGLTSAVLRRPGPDGELLGVAGDVVHAVPTARGGAVVVPVTGRPVPSVELPVPGARGGQLAALTVCGARPSQLPALRAAAAVLGLALAERPAAPSPAVLLLDAEEEADALADALHDGPVQALVAARYACDLAVRAGDAGPAREAVQEALVALRRTLWHLRPRGADDLPAGLAALSARLVEAGLPPLHLVLDTTAAHRLAPAARTVVYRLVQAVSADGGVRVALRASGGDLVVDVDGGRALDGPDRWRRRLRALGGDLSSSAGRLRLQLPAAPDPSTSPGSDDPKACS